MATIIKTLCFSFIIFSSFATLFSVADGRRFNVGGNGGWVISPKENYNTWAERNRFQVNDTLYFKYVKGLDSVQQVMKSDYYGCNVENPIKKFDNGESEFKFDRSGPFFFISGNKDHCNKGQRLIVVVLAVRHHNTVPISPAKSPSASQPPKSPSPVSPIAPAKSPTASQPPKSPSPVSPANSPSSQPPKSSSPVSPISPAKPPSKTQPPKSPSPDSHSPSVSPSHAPAKSPVTPTPSAKSPSPALSPSPTNSPKSSPSPSQTPTSPAPETTPTLTPSPSETIPAADNFKAPAPSPKNSASGVAVNSVMTTILSLAVTVLMFA
ncbi:unnamed protein product [Cochlearia groenlandica]